MLVDKIIVTESGGKLDIEMRAALDWQTRQPGVMTHLEAVPVI